MRKVTINWLGLFNLAAVYLGGKWVLALLGINPSWSQYTGASLAALLVWVLANLSITTEHRWR